MEDAAARPVVGIDGGDGGPIWWAISTKAGATWLRCCIARSCQQWFTDPMTQPGQIVLTPIGTVVGGRSEPIDDYWAGVRADIVIDDRFGADAVAGLEAFSHLDVVYFFHLVGEADITTGARHPRGNKEWPRVGIFAQRAKARPNRIGVSTCELVSVDGLTLHVAGLDAIDGTPVLDVKPHLETMGARGPVREPNWSAELMRDYW